MKDKSFMTWQLGSTRCMAGIKGPQIAALESVLLWRKLCQKLNWLHFPPKIEERALVQFRFCWYREKINTCVVSASLTTTLSRFCTIRVDDMKYSMKGRCGFGMNHWDRGLEACLGKVLIGWRSRNNAVGIVTCYGLDGSGIESRVERFFPCLSRTTVRPIQHPR